MTCREKLRELHPDWDKQQLDFALANFCPDLEGNIDIELPRDEDGSLWCAQDKCEQCWDREITDTEPLTYEHTGEPIGKVIDITEDENGVTAIIKKEKNMATKKTKAELMEELDNIKEAKAELEKELQSLEKYKQYKDCAEETKALHTAFVNAGFSNQMAFELMKMIMQSAISQNFTKAVLKR
jgi:hypothetical protein